MKTKKLTKIAGVITLLACIWGGVSCEQNLPEETYTVTFDSDGGSEIKPVTVKDGEKVTKPEADPTKDGYTFKGWFNGDTEYDFETAVTANITLKAKWEVVVVNYKVTFDSDGGSEVAAVEVKDGEKVTKPAADPTKAGYTFKGWFIGDKEYDFKTSVTDNITLKAKWEVVTYTVTFDSNGGSEIEPVTVKDGEKVTKPADPTKTGYTFKGWLNGETVYDFEKSVTSNITLKAKWEVVTYTVTFDSNGGSDVAAVKVNHGEKVTKPEDPTKTGYTFKGWLNGETVYDFEKAVTADITLKAKWEVVTYNITYELDGGTGYEGNPKTYTIETDDITIKDPVSGPAETPNFAGWYSDKDCVKPADTTIKKGSTGNLSFYAKWSDKSIFTVTFDSNGDSDVAPVKVEDGGKVPKPADPTKTGYTFKGWLDGESVYDFEKAVTADITLKAKWEVVTYTVTFNSDGDSEVESAKVNHGEKVPKPADPTKPGYTFKGWFYGDKEYDFETAVAADITLEAKWEENTYTVTFDFGVTSQTIKYNGTAEEPTAPTKDGYDFVGWYEGDKKFDFATKITKDISLTAKWEEKKATEPETPPASGEETLLPTTFKIGETYSGKVTYPMVENSGFGNATASDVIFNIDLSEQTLKTKDVVKLTFKVTESSSDAINSLGYQSQIDNWGWHSISVKELGSTYNLSFEVGETTEFEGNLVGIKLTPQDSDGSLIGKDLVIKIEDLSVTLVPYVEGAEKDFWTADTAEGYDFGLGCDYSKGIGIDASSLQAGNILTFYYTLTKVENEWGVYSQLKLCAGYSAKVLPSATDVGANEYGQINVSGTSFSYELTEADITAFAAESEDYKRLMVFGHNVILTKITVK